MNLVFKESIPDAYLIKFKLRVYCHGYGVQTPPLASALLLRNTTVSLNAKNKDIIMSGKNLRMYTAPVPKMPPGLVELMEGLAKDVLRCNPPDVYSYCANHIKKLIEIRDGPSHKRVMTLEQKIAMATKKIRERAVRRCKDYDSKIRSENENNQGYENNKINSDAGQYIKDNIVIVPEEDLNGDAEHEIIVEMKEKDFSAEYVKSAAEIDPETTIADIESVNALPPSTVQESTKTNEYENIGDNQTIEEIQENLTNDMNENKIIDIDQKNCHDADNTVPNYEEKCSESVAETKNDAENEGDLECEKFTNNYDDRDKCDIEANIENNEANLNSIKETVDDSIVVDEKNDFNSFAERADHAINNSEKTFDKTTLHTLIDTEEGNTDNAMNKDQIYVLEQQQDNKSMSAILPNLRDNDDDYETLSGNNSELHSNVNNTSMDLETAAITIQKVFRNFLFRNKTLSTDDATNVDINSLIEDKNEKGDNDILSMNINNDRRTLGLSRIDAVLQTVNEEKSLSQSTDDSSTLSSAATIIQAHVRGFLIRNKLNVNKNSSTTSGIDSDGLSMTSIEGDNEYRKNKTILNIHIVPESGHFISRDGSVLTSMDLSLDGSPPCSTNLHPLGYERSERRKQLRREDAIQSISPPSNNSGKSEDVDSVKEMAINRENNKNENSLHDETCSNITDAKEIKSADIPDLNDVNISTMVDNLDTALEVKSLGPFESPVKYIMTERPHSLPEITSDEMDVITPFTPSKEKRSNDGNLIHSGEFHDVVLPTKVVRSDTSVVRGE